MPNKYLINNLSIVNNSHTIKYLINNLSIVNNSHTVKYLMIKLSIVNDSHAIKYLINNLSTVNISCRSNIYMWEVGQSTPFFIDNYVGGGSINPLIQ